MRSEDSLENIFVCRSSLGKPTRKKSAVFFNIVQKAFDAPPPLPPLSFEDYVVNFSEGILTRLRKRMSQQLSTK